MKLDYYEIKYLEEENNAILLSRLQKEQQYLYVKISKRYPEKIFTIPITMQNGNRRNIKFVKLSDLEKVKRDERLKNAEPQKRRKVRGRPFDFCKDCEHLNDCSADTPCIKRDERKKLEEIGQDERFWNNGTPKKHLILCKYAKYMYAHKKTAGQCQKEKCSFYDSGKCYLNLTPKIVNTEEVKPQQRTQINMSKETSKPKNNVLSDKKTEFNQIEYYIRELNELDKRLTEIELSKSNDVNVFYATGMTTQEIKHSAFLAWLLNPNQSHKKGNTFLAGFLNLLCEYDGNAEEDIKSNKEILANSDIKSFSDFTEFLNADDIVVETEKVISNPESRIDIFIQSKKTETTIVIENKVFTGTHDEQLDRYEKETAVFTGRKIYIYLTPNGDMPTNMVGEYQENWTIISYKSIIDLLEKQLKDIPKSKQFEKLIFLLKDYIEMVDTNILRNNMKVRALCRDILKKHADAIELLNHYTDNIDDVYEFINGWIKENISGVHYIYFKGRQLCFYTNKIFEFFAKYGRQVEITKTWFSFGTYITSKDGPIKLGIGLGKQTEEWGEPETIIKTKALPDKPFGNKYCTLYQIELLSESDRQMSLDEIKAKLEEKLQAAKIKLEEIESLI